MSFWRSNRVHARKDYRCAECRGPIEVGQAHWSHAGVHEGEFQDYRTCLACEALWQAVHREFPYACEDGRFLGELRSVVLPDECEVTDVAAWIAEHLPPLEAQEGPVGPA